MTRGETTSAAPPTISGNVKKNGLSWAPVSRTSSVANVIATLPSTMNLAVPSEFGGSRSWITSTNRPAAARSAKIAGWVSGQRPVTATIIGRREDEDPADDPDDAVVRAGRDAVPGSYGAGRLAGDRRRTRRRSGPARRSGRPTGGHGTAPAEHGRDQDEAHHDEVRENRDKEQCQDGLEVARHLRSSLTAHRNAGRAP